MVWLTWLIIFLALMCGLFIGLYQRVRRKGKQVAETLRLEYGSNLKLVTGCGVIIGYSRVPGVLALLKDRIVYRSLLAGKKGEIYLHNIVGFSCEDTSKTQYRRARKYRNACVLAIKTDEEEILFAVEKETAPSWESSIKKALK